MYLVVCVCDQETRGLENQAVALFHETVYRAISFEIHKVFELVRVDSKSQAVVV